MSHLNPSPKSPNRDRERRPIALRPKMEKNIIILIKISHLSLSLHDHSLPFSLLTSSFSLLWSLSPFLSSHFFIFSSLSLILTFSFSLPFVSTATTLKVTVTVGHGSLLTGSHQLSLKKTQTSLSKNSNLSHQIRSLSAKLSRWWRRFASGLVVVVVA